MIKLTANGFEVEFKTWKFPGNDVGVKIDTENFHCDQEFNITLILPTSDEIMMCLNLMDALKRLDVNQDDITLTMPYVPYGRQDRVCHPGESFALRVFANIIRDGYFEHMVISDPHSQVTENLFIGEKSLYVIEQWECAANLPKFDALIAPDKGASKKIEWHNQVRDLGVPYFTLSKTRADNRIIYDDYPYDTIKGSVCVVDDICDKGGTFLALGEMLKRTQPTIKSLNLYVTHGLMGDGLDKLKVFYDNIYVHNLMNDEIRNDPRLIEI